MVRKGDDVSASPTSDGIIAEIVKAENERAVAEAKCDELQKQYKDAKRDYEFTTDRLRSLCASLRNDANRPLFDRLDKSHDLEPAVEKWRSVSLKDVPLGCVPGLSVQKMQLLIDTCETMGGLEDLRAGGGFRSLKGFGEVLATDLEKWVLNWLRDNRSDDPIEESSSVN